MFKYQETFAEELFESWQSGNYAYVRTTIRNLKNKAQASYIAASIAANLTLGATDSTAVNNFLKYMHPNNA